MNSAEIILSQLGGSNRLKLMIGAHNFFSKNEGRTLIFKFKGCKSANCLEITHNASDLYDVKLLKTRPMNRKTYEIPAPIVAGEFEDIYSEDLMDLIERETGLYLTLHSRR